MIDLAIISFKLLLRGKLFRDPAFVVRQGFLAVAITGGAIVGLRLLHLPLLAAVVIGAFVGGFLTPYLFKDLKAA